MRIAFMGTPEFSVPSLGELLAAGHEIVAVYTQPPRPAGRGHKQRKSPVHQFAEAHGLIVRTPLNFREDEDCAAFSALDLDVAIVVAYGLILPRAILEAPRLGCLNVHASLLPRWRGAAPIQRAIMAGDAMTGVQIMQMEKGLDTGPVLLSETVPITLEDTAESLTNTLSVVGAGLLPRALAALDRGGLIPTAQPEDGVTYASKITPQEARLDWARPAAELDRHIRGLAPFPGAWFEALDPQGEKVRIKALMSRVSDVESTAEDGVIVAADGALSISTGSGVLSLTKMQRAGRAAQSAEDFLRGMPLSIGDKVL